MAANHSLYFGLGLPKQSLFQKTHPAVAGHGSIANWFNSIRNVIMVKNPLFYLCVALVSGCTGNDPVKQSAQVTNRGYFADANQCRQSSASKQNMLVPGGTTVQIPLGYDQNEFIACMAHAGRPVPRDDLTGYTEVSTTCLEESREAENPDEAYASCIKRGNLNIEIIEDK
ncbi:MAG: hypothetical protein ABSB19_18455 [Methylomonas sp.]|jgi:hypothetical protein